MPSAQLTDAQWEIIRKTYTEKKNTTKKELLRLEGRKMSPNTKEANRFEIETGEKLSSSKTFAELLKRPQVLYDHLPGKPKEIKKNVVDEIEASIKYAGYIERQKTDVERLQKNENTKIPTTVNYENVVGLSNEVKQKLSEARPQSLARASRLPGVTPAAISLLMVHLKKERKRKAS